MYTELILISNDRIVKYNELVSRVVDRIAV